MRDGTLVYELQDAERQPGMPEKENRWQASFQGKAPIEEREACARLAAAAPEMLKVLRAARDALYEEYVIVWDCTTTRPLSEASLDPEEHKGIIDPDSYDGICENAALIKRIDAVLAKAGGETDAAR